MAIGLGVKCIARILRNPATLVTPTPSRSGINISYDHERQVRSISEQTSRTVMKPINPIKDTNEGDKR